MNQSFRNCSTRRYYKHITGSGTSRTTLEEKDDGEEGIDGQGVWAMVVVNGKGRGKEKRKGVGGGLVSYLKKCHDHQPRDLSI